MLSTPDPGLRRVSVHAGPAVVDLALPAAVPIASLIPSIVDILDGGGADRPGTAYRLSPLGVPALRASTTLAQNDIRDGAVLILSQSHADPPAPRHHDVAEAVAMTLDGDAQPWTKRATRLTGAVAAGFFTAVGVLTLIRNSCIGTTRDATATTGVAAATAVVALLLAHRAPRDAIMSLTLSLVATAFAALAGFTASPGPPGVPNVLTAALAAAVASVLAIRLTNHGALTLTAVACFAMIAAGAAFAGVLTVAPLRAIASMSALASLVLLGIAGRISIVLAGLSPHPSEDAHLADKAIRADAWLTSLLGAFSSSTAVAAIVTAATGAPNASCIAFGTATGALLLLRARSAFGKSRLVLVISGTATIGTTFAIWSAGATGRAPWIAAVMVMLVAAAVYMEFVSPSPLLRRCVELSEYVAMLAMAPLACWVCGFYGAVRALNPA